MQETTGGLRLEGRPAPAISLKPLREGRQFVWMSMDGRCSGAHPMDNSDGRFGPALLRPGRQADRQDPGASVSSPSVLLVGGTDHYLRIPFFLQLQAKGFRAIAAGTGDQEPFQRAGIPFMAFGFDRFVNPLADWRSVRQLAGLIAACRPDIVQSFDTKPNVLVPLATVGLPKLGVVKTVNGLGWVYSSREPLALALRPVQRALHRLVSRHVTATVFQNRDDLAFFEQAGLMTAGSGHLIPGSGIDIEGFTRKLAAASAPGQLRADLGLGGAKIVLTVSRLTRQKGIPTLLKAAALVHRVRPDVRFLLVGPRGTEGRLAIAQHEIDQHRPYVIAVGQRDDVPALLRMADVFAFPTEYREGVPRALLEAALAECPIVSSLMPGCSDVINEGDSGYLVPPGKPDALAARILELLEHPGRAQAMAQRAAAVVRSNFGLSLTVDRYVALYQRVLALSSTVADTIENRSDPIPGALYSGLKN